MSSKSAVGTQLIFPPHVVQHCRLICRSLRSHHKKETIANRSRSSTPGEQRTPRHAPRRSLDLATPPSTHDRTIMRSALTMHAAAAAAAATTTGRRSPSSASLHRGATTRSGQVRLRMTTHRGIDEGTSFLGSSFSSAFSDKAAAAAAASRRSAGEFRVSATTADPTAPTPPNPGPTVPSSPPLRYEMVQGPLVQWSVESPTGPHPPTAVLIHGILGSRRNLLSFAKRLSQKFPSWQFLLVDLRCHGQTANMDQPPQVRCRFSPQQHRSCSPHPHSVL